MFFWLSKALTFLLNPLLWIILMIFLSICVKNKRAKTVYKSLAFILLLLLGNRQIVNRVYQTWEYKTLQVEDVEEVYDIGIVLVGFSYNKEDKPNGASFYNYGNFSSTNRLSECIQLYKNGLVKKLLLSGGSGSLNPSALNESYEIKDYLLKLGIPAEDIIVEPNSRNTYESSIAVGAILDKLKFNRVLLLTSAFHMRRAIACYDKQSIKVIPFSVDFIASYERRFSVKDIIPSSYALIMWQTLIKECVGLLVYKLTGKC